MFVYEASKYANKLKKEERERQRNSDVADAEQSFKRKSLASPSAAPAGNRIGPATVSLKFSDEQRGAIERCKAAFNEAGGCIEEHADIFVARWLIAKQWNEKEAMRGLVENAKWRKQAGADDVRKQFASGEVTIATSHPKMVKFLAIFPTLTLLGKTRGGDVVKIIDFGGVDVDRFLKELDNDDVFECALRTTEAELLEADRESARRGELCRVAMIALTKGISLKHLDMKKRTAKSGQVPEMYPELFFCGAYPQAPWAAKMAWGVLKPMFPKEVQQRIFLLGNATESAKVLHGIISPSILPKEVFGKQEFWSDAYRKKIGLDDPLLAQQVRDGFVKGNSQLASFVKC